VRVALHEGRSVPQCDVVRKGHSGIARKRVFSSAEGRCGVSDKRWHGIFGQRSRGGQAMTGQWLGQCLYLRVRRAW
jgi:hypothetical protein